MEQKNAHHGRAGATEAAKVSRAVTEAFRPVAHLVRRAVLPGAALGVVHVSGARQVVWSGSAQIDPTVVPLSRGTYFDLASLTKTVFTTSAFLSLVERGLVNLDARLDEILDLMPDDPGAPERALTLLQCLSHQTSLPAVEPLYLLGFGPDDLRRHVLQRQWSRQATPVYSDINFIFLGLAMEAVTGTPLREQPLVDGLTFAPESAHCAATERCPWRGRVIRGEVHDENAFALGGVAGHAGLFGTVDGVLNFALSLLEWHRESPMVSELLACEVSQTRTIGWERAHPGWSGGSRCSPRCIGHVGFTGTGLWIDLELGVAWTLLTNRIHPTRGNAAPVQRLRPLVSDAVLGAMNLV